MKQIKNVKGIENMYFLLLLFITWIILLLRKRKMILSLPYLFMFFVTPIYNVLDSKIFVKIFGCGCVKYGQTNMLNINFNANDLRIVVYSVITIFMCILGILLSRKLPNKKTKVIYVITILLVNILLSFMVCEINMWM